MPTNGNTSAVRLVWTKGEGVGPFKFGEEIDAFRWAFDGAISHTSDSMVEVAHRVKGCRDADVYSEGGRVTSVGSNSVFVVGDTNIIGSTDVQAIQTLGRQPDEIELEQGFDRDQTVLYFYDFGLMLWTKEGAVVSVHACVPF